MNERIVVTGATSFIGIALLSLLQENGLEVIAIIRPCSARKLLLRQLYPNLKILECSFDELGQATLPLEKYDALFHIGWSSDFPDARYNLEGQMENVKYCLNAVELAHRYGCDSFLCVGSQAECGIVDHAIDSLTPEHPITAYARAKCIAYEKTADLCRSYGIYQYWPRLLSAYGPFARKSTLIMSCICACREKRVLHMTAAEQIWDYIYIRDVAEALFAVWKYGMPEKRYTIASGKGRKLKEYITEIAREANWMQLLEGVGKRDYTSQEVMRLEGNIRELIEDTGFMPKWSFIDGIRETIKCFDSWEGKGI